jgi:hypothetical protein
MSPLDLATKHKADAYAYEDALCSVEEARPLYEMYARKLAELNASVWAEAKTLPPPALASLEAAMAKELIHTNLLSIEAIRMVPSA